MKAKFLFMLCSFLMMFVTLSSFTTEVPSNELSCVTQESEEINAIYKGSSSDGFNFEVEEEGETITVVFQQIEEPVLSVYDLHSETFIDVNFKVTFTTGIDDNGDAVKTITNLEKL
ncbi:hypothetical protein [Hyunsoonleella ulvae]|uniref:hypothetical protein n=1 Tax=Hyunsoonleella ulvae TaxID=2799948 RepID=UPI00193971E7|nr:hypothetical protein [Hyunsoonleella ulvae]